MKLNFNFSYFDKLLENKYIAMVWQPFLWVVLGIAVVFIVLILVTILIRIKR